MAPFIIYQYIGHQKEEGAAEYLPFPWWNDGGPCLMRVSIAAVCPWSCWTRMAAFHGALLHPCFLLFPVPWCFQTLEGWSVYVLFSPNDHFLSALWPSLCTITLCENERLWLMLTTAVVASSPLAHCHSDYRCCEGRWGRSSTGACIPLCPCEVWCQPAREHVHDGEIVAWLLRG